MTDQSKQKKVKFSQIVGHYHNVIGEAFLLNEKNADVLPRTYKVEFFIFLRPGEAVVEIEYTVLQHGEAATDDTTVQQVNITTTNQEPVGKPGEGEWLGYEFEISKNMPELLILEFSVNDTDTDPKPKVIYEDPLEIDPGDGAGN
ncbi:MAG: hypothetical protein Roseis2KO_33680 [Roseivirga sp.]